MTLKLRLQHVDMMGAMCNSSWTTLQNFAKSFFLGSFRNFFRKCAQITPKMKVSKNVQMTSKLGLHHLPSVGAVPRCSELCLEKVWKSSFLGPFRHIFKKCCEKKFFPWKSNFVPITASFFRFCFNYRLLFSWVDFFPKSKMFISDPKTKVD